MTDESKVEYEATIKQLHELVRSDSLMQHIRENRDKSNEQNIPDMWILLKELSITQKDIDQLCAIHVTGTKGKGSTCAFTESIIRHHGYKTLFFSSPHIREVRERIRLDGKPLSYQAFSDYFLEIYDQLKHLKDDDNTLMHFYNFLMIMSLYIAIKEKRSGNVDAVIIEGMLGGEYDYTNIFEDKVVCGVSSLGLDHVDVLGRTIDQIAWHKAGIFRRHVPAITVQQAEEAMKVLYERAKEKETVLSVCPTLEAFGPNIELGIDGEVQTLNAALALQLSREWLRHKQNSGECRNGNYTNRVPANSCDKNVPLITESERKGLKNCKVTGKCDIMKLERMTIHLDCAHTLESIQNCIEWFDERCTDANHSGVSMKKILLIAIPTDRSAERLLRPLKDYPFDIAIFPVHVSEKVETSPEHPIFHAPMQTRIDVAKFTKQTWDKANKDRIVAGTQRSVFCNSIHEGLGMIMEERSKLIQANKNVSIQVLATGGVAFVGKCLRLLDGQCAGKNSLGV